MNMNNPMRTFDPAVIAHGEKESWAAYYQKRWIKLLWVFVRLVRSTYGLSLWQTLGAAYLLTRAQIAFARRDNNVRQAEAYMRRFFMHIKQIEGEKFDVSEVARLEVRWWIVHRRSFGQGNNLRLVEALMSATAAVYGVDPACLREAAAHRARAMVYSDRWVQAGALNDKSPLLAQEEAELLLSYRALRAAVGPAL